MFDRILITSRACRPEQLRESENYQSNFLPVDPRRSGDWTEAAESHILGVESLQMKVTQAEMCIARPRTLGLYDM